ncbi:MAG TPA: SIS domain-containing protein [Candidatus Limnocylindria bacterium]|nr:SIS domain-containing protein [Candidatus Limnocylindria bacterium]
MITTPTLMRREIDEIPDVLERILASPDVRRVAAAITDARPRWIAIAARGTSDHAAVYAGYLLETHLGIPTGLAKPSVTTIYGASVDWSGGLVLAISQSGRSPDIVSVVTAARESGALTVAITNDSSSPLAAEAAHALDCLAGPELAVPATKTYVAELGMLALLADAIRPRTALTAGLAGVPDALRAAIERTDAWLAGDGAATVRALAGADRALLVSRGYNLPTALELALKLKETCGLFAEAYSTADFAHGPLVLARSGIPVLAIRPDGEMGRLVDETMAAAIGRGGRATIIGGPECASTPAALSLSDRLPEILTPLVYVVPGQLIVEATARAMGLSPDAPQGLGKVTLTR